MNIRRVVPNISSEDLEASKDFYVEFLGMEIGMDLGWIVGFGSPSNETAQIQLIRRDETAPVTPSITVEVEDVGALYEEALARKLEIVHPLTDESWGVRRFFVKDPNGVVLNVMSHL